MQEKDPEVVSHGSSDVAPPDTRMPSAVIENEQIYAAFENSIAHRVNQRLDEKLARRQATYIGAVAIIITVITAIGGFVGNLVLELQVNTQVRELLAQEAAQIVQDAEFLPRVATLEIQLRQWNNAEGVNPDQLQRAIDDFEMLYSRFVAPGLSEAAQEHVNGEVASPEAIAQQVARARERQLANSFDFLVQILSALDQVNNVEQLGEIAPGLALESKIALQSLSQSYGRQVIGAAGAPESWSEGNPFHETFVNYRTWSNRARQNGYPELFYLFESIIWHLEEQDFKNMEEILQDIDGLNDVYGNNYEGLLFDLAQEAFINTPNGFSSRVAERTRDFIAKNADHSVRVAKVAEAIQQ